MSSGGGSIIHCKNPIQSGKILILKKKRLARHPNTISPQYFALRSSSTTSTLSFIRDVVVVVVVDVLLFVQCHLICCCFVLSVLLGMLRMAINPLVV